MSDIDTAAADGLKVLDPKRPIREADMVRLYLRSRLEPLGFEVNARTVGTAQPKVQDD